jgi:hypothetical protein
VTSTSTIWRRELQTSRASSRAAATGGQSSRATSSTTSAAPSSRAAWGARAPGTAWNDSPPGARGGLTPICTRRRVAASTGWWPRAAEGSGPLVIGKNPLWQQEGRLGRRTHQQVGCIPPARFIERLTDKAELVGIQVLVTAESYTRKASFLDADPRPV